MTKLGQHLQTERHLKFIWSSALHRVEYTNWLTIGEQRVEAKSTIILGNSTIINKYVDTRTMKSEGKNVFRKCLPGSSTEDLKQDMVPLS